MQRKNLKYTTQLLCFVALVLQFGANRVLAQSIIPAADGTGTSVNTPVGNPNQFDITGGTQAGANLFHSFQELGLSQGQIANFLANPSIHNILGRVTGGNASVINGLIQVTGSNANLFLMNPAGIVFGPNASLNVPASFTATTANAIGVGGGWFNATGSNDYQFLTGTPNSFVFSSANPGAILNAGNLAVGNGQSVMLLGGTVVNTGTISAPGGNITIAAIPGERMVRVTPEGSLLSLMLPMETRSQINSSSITPLSLPTLLTGAGIPEATGIVVENGVVKLTASNTSIPTDSGTAIVSGQISTSSLSATSATPSISVLGDRVGLFSANLDASSLNGGGTVLIGGDFQGKGTVPNAQYTFVSQDSVIRADALQSGTGGKVVLWADHNTGFYGSISAKGGAIAGDGGSVEVSGKQNLIFRGKVDTSASNGAMGNLLLDPTDIVIVNGTADGSDTDGFNNTLTGGQVLTGDTPAAFTIYESELQGMAAATNITLEASNNITINNLSDNTLTFQSLVGGGGGSIQFTADSDNDGVGAFTMLDLNDTIVASGRNVTISGASINAGNISTFTTSTNNAGSINLTATQGNLSTRNLNAYSSNNTGSGNGGNVTLSALNGSLSTNGINTYSQATTGNAANAGAIALSASGDITTSGSLSAYASTTTGNTGTGGNISLISANGAVSTNTVNTYSRTTDGNAGSAGSVAINSAGNFTTGSNSIQAYSQSINSGNAGNGGNVSITSANGSLTRNYIGTYSRANTGDTGNAGAIALNANGDITVASGANLDTYASTTTGNTGTGGNISLNSTNGIVSTYTVNTYSQTTNGNAGNAGAFTVNSAGNFTTNNNWIQTYSRSATTGNAGYGGNVSLTTAAGTLTTSYINSSARATTGNAGNGGEIVLNANGDITTNNSFDAYSLTSTGNSGASGNISVSSSNGNVSTRSLNAYSQSSDGSAGNAGSITVNAANSFTTNNNAINTFSRSYSNGSTGDGGTINVTASSIDTGTGGLSSFSNRGGTGTFSTGNGGNITLAATDGNLNATGNFNSSTYNPSGDAGNAGNITLQATNGAINAANFYTNSTSQADGNSAIGGNVRLTATDNVTAQTILTQSFRNGAGTGNSGQAGDITVISGGTISTQGLTANSQSNNGSTGNGGAVTLNAQNTIQTSNIQAYSSATNGNSGTGGQVSATSTNGAITTGYIDSYSNVSGSGTAGNASAIALSANGNISTGSLNAFSRNTGSSGNSGNGADITLNSTTGSITTTGGVLSFAQSFNANAGSAGNVTISAANGVTIGASGGYGSINAQPSGLTSAGNGGNISITTPNGNITTSSYVGAGSFGSSGSSANAGNITLTATGGSISTGGYIGAASGAANGNAGNAGTISITANSTNGIISTNGQAINSYSQSSANGSSGNGGSINVSASALNLGGGVNTFSNRTGAGTGTAGNGGTVVLAATSGNLSVGSVNASSRSNVGNTGNGGNASLTSTGNITAGAIDARTETAIGNSGNAGAINLTANGNINTGSLDLRSRVLTNGNAATGGNATIQGDAITIGSFISTQSEVLGTGNASNGGNISITGTGDVSLPALRSFSWSTNGTAQNAGDVFISTPGTLTTANNSIFAYSLSNQNGGTGNGGNVTINAGTADLGTGSIQTYSQRFGAGTFNTSDGGAISINAANGITTGQLQTFSYQPSVGNTGNAGDVTLKSTNGNITTAGMDVDSNAANTGNAGKGAIVTLTADNGSITSGNINARSNTNNGNASDGGTIELSASGNIAVNNLYTYSNVSGTGNTGTGGNISVVSSNGNVTTSGVNAYTRTENGTASNAGNINLAAHPITGTLTANTSFIDAYSQSNANGASGVGGNINLSGGTINLGTSQVRSYSQRYGAGAFNSGGGGNITITSYNSLVIPGDVGTNSGQYGAAGTAGSAGNITVSVTNGSLSMGQVYAQVLNGTGNAGNGGNINLSASGSMSTATLRSYTSTNTGNTGKGGNINVQATSGNLSTLDLQSYSYTNNGVSDNAGSVTLKAASDISTRNINAEGDRGTSNGGMITLTSTNGGINTNTGTVSSQIRDGSPGTGDGGNIAMTARNDITTGVVNAGTQSGTSGNIDLRSTNGNITTNGALYTDAMLGGQGGAINAKADGGNITINGAFATSFMNIGNAGSAGSINLDAAGTLTTTSLYTMTWTNSGNAGNGGQVTLNGGNGVTVNTGNSWYPPTSTPGWVWVVGDGIKTLPYSISGGALGNSGDVTITSNNGLVTLNTPTIDTRGFGTTSRSGDVTINAQGNITTRAIQADAPGANAIGGNITLTSTNGAINTTGGGLDTGWNGTGGNINLTASGDITTANLRPAVYFNSNGNAGNVTVTSINGSINTTAGNIDTRRTGTGSGDGGTISLNANGNVTTGNVLSNSTGASGNGGSIAINSTGGAINTTAGNVDASSTNGTAGAIALTALTNTTGSVTVSNVTSTGVTGNPLTVTAGGLISQAGGTRINVTGNASFDTTNFANAGTVSVTNSASSGTVIGNSIIGGNFALISTGNVSQGAGTSLKVAGVGTINTAGNATLNNAEGDFTIGNNVFVRRAGIVDLPTHTVSGDMTVTSLADGLQFNTVYMNNAITLNSANNSFGGTLSLNTAYSGNQVTGAPTGIIQSGLQTIGGATTLNAQPTGNITLNQNNDFNTVQVVAGQNVSINDVNAVTLAASTATGNFSLTTDGTLTQAGNLNVGGATVLMAGSSNIASNAAITSGSLTLAGNSITLNSPISAVTGGVTLTNSGQATISSTADINAAGAFGQNGTGSVSIAGDITAGSINFSQPVTLTGPINLSTTNGAIQFQSTIAGNQDLTLNAGTGNITMAGAVDVGNLVTSSTGTTRFDGAVQATSLTTNAGGTTQINGSSVTTTGNQTYGDAISLGANTTLQGDSIKFDSPVDAGTRSLTINANEIDFNGAVFGSSALTLQPLSAGQDIAIAGTSNTTAALDLTATDLSQLQPGFSNITIGRSDGTGIITLNPFTFQSPVTIAGGSTLVGANQNTTWNITGSNTGTVSGFGSSVSFVSIENLVGGTKNDTFRFNSGGFISGNIDGIGTIDTLDYSAYNAPVTVALGTTTPGTATGVGGTILSIENVIGSSVGNNTLIGENTRNTWRITNANTGAVNEVTFRNFQNLIGSTNSDIFIFSNGAYITGIIDGGPGFDTLDYTAYTTPVIVDLLANIATGTNGVYNIEDAVFAIAPPRETALMPLPLSCMLPKVLFLVEGETIETDPLPEVELDQNCHVLRERNDSNQSRK